MEGCVFISSSACLSQSLPHTAIHYLSMGQGKLSWGPIVFLVEFSMCVSVCFWHFYCAYRRCQGDWGRCLGPRGKSWLQGGLSSPLGPAGLLEEPGMETVEWGGGGRPEEVLGQLLPSH